MKNIIRRRILAAIIFLVVLFDLSAAFLLFRSRYFSHLAVWRIIESSKKTDFSRPPEIAPAYFVFESGDSKL